MALSFVFIVVLAIAFLAPTEGKLHPLSDEYISLINSKQNSWKAGRNFLKDTPMSYIRNIMGAVKDDSISDTLRVEYDADLIASLPEHFDPREKWPNCPSLNEIRDQGNCGSGWAMAAVAVMTDRMCIHSNGTKHFHFSAADLIACEGPPYPFNNTCISKSMVNGWFEWSAGGIVSGGSYNSSEGCMPYMFPPCEQSDVSGKNPCFLPYIEAPKCVRKCRDGYNVEYSEDKHRGDEVAGCEGDNNIRAELFVNGSVEVLFLVYPDFLHYKSGVYYHTGDDDYISMQAAKILGWGEEDGKKYWLAANSWGTGWGDKGFFKILRGSNECQIELLAIYGWYAKVNSSFFSMPRN